MKTNYSISKSSSNLVYSSLKWMSYYRLTVPYPFFLNLLMQLDGPEHFNHLPPKHPTGKEHSWSSKAFEALGAMRAADSFFYDHPCDPFRRGVEVHQISRVPCRKE
ncbi:unnamed protein product [Effrenium voratum]|nr:unnamed protein product [Effrenium voratum]